MLAALSRLLRKRKWARDLDASRKPVRAKGVKIPSTMHFETEPNLHVMHYRIAKVLAEFDARIKLTDVALASAFVRERVEVGDIALASTFLRMHGYRVLNPLAKNKHKHNGWGNGQLVLDGVGDERPALNALGKPFSASFSPTYTLSHKPPRLPRRRFYPRKWRSRDIRFEQG